MTHQELLRFFHANYPRLVSDMRNTDHAWNKDDLNPYHLEGTIFEHTMLVFHEAIRRGYDFETQLACLLHDIGKPYAMMRNKEKQKVTFYNHESESVFRSLQIMEDLKLPQATRERLVKVIGLHTEVFKQPLQALYNLIGDAETYRKLTQLANCDHSGRFADLDNATDYTYFSPAEKVKVSEHKAKVVTLLVGLPYSGKSSHIEVMRGNPPFIVSRDNIINLYEGDSYNKKWKNADQVEVDRILQSHFQLAKQHSNVVVDMTHMSLKSRRRTLSHFGKDWQKNCIVLLPTLAEIGRRSLFRTEKFIDNSVLDAMMSSFRPPCLGEGFDNITYKF
jgi:predicted kinase